MSGPVPIDLARAADDEAIGAMAREAGLKVDPAAERARPQARLLVARRPGPTADAVGFVLGWVVADEVEVLDLCVRKDARRAGIGAALVSQLLRTAGAEGVTSAFLEVRVSNAGAISLYEGLGFSVTGRREGYYSDGEDAALFRCCLAPSP